MLTFPRRFPIARIFMIGLERRYEAKVVVLFPKVNISSILIQYEQNGGGTR